jgi:hypothetical protein
MPSPGESRIKSGAGGQEDLKNLDSGFRRNDTEGFIVRCDLLRMIARQKVLLRSERPVTDQAEKFEFMAPAPPAIVICRWVDIFSYGF